MSPDPSTKDQTRRFEGAFEAIGVLFEPTSVMEIRALDVGRTPDKPGSIHSGYFHFENRKGIEAALQRLDGRAQGVYVVLNSLNPTLLARAANRVQSRPKYTTSDADIVEWRWLYIDLDAVRPAGVSATDEEHLHALERAQQLKDYLASRQWPDPVVADSGNGAHLLYRLQGIELKVAADLVKKCLKVLAKDFSDGLVKVDESTANASRLCRLYGTMTCKGDSTTDRPHRRSALLEIPERIEAVPIALLEALASTALDHPTRPVPANGRRFQSGGFQIEQWLIQGGVEILKGPEPYEGGRKWTLPHCPFNPEHSKPVIIELQNGALAFKCLHNSCSENDWHAFRRTVEPDADSTQIVRGVRSSERSMDESCLITDLSEIPSVFSLESKLDWLIEGIIASGSIAMICAESGTGKTWLGYYLAACVGRGAPVFGLSTKAAAALYLDGENPLYLVKQRLLDLGFDETPNLTIWGGWNTSPPVGPDHPLIVEFARKHKGLIVFDSLIEFHPGSEQSSTETRAFMRHFRQLANLGATVVILHHTGKAETSKQYRGSSDIKAAVDTAYLLSGNSDQSNVLDRLSLVCFKSRLAPGRDFHMKFVKRVGLVASDGDEGAEVIQFVTNTLAAQPKLNQSQLTKLAQEAGFAKNELERALKSGPWVREPGTRNSLLFSLPGRVPTYGEPAC